MCSYRVHILGLGEAPKKREPGAGPSGEAEGGRRREAEERGPGGVGTAQRRGLRDVSNQPGNRHMQLDSSSNQPGNPGPKDECRTRVGGPKDIGNIALRSSTLH